MRPEARIKKLWRKIGAGASDSDPEGLDRADSNALGWTAKRLPLVVGAVVITGIGLALFWLSWVNDSLLRQVAHHAAVRWATKIEQSIDLENLASGGDLSHESEHVLRLATELGDVFRYKIYAADGTVILASMADDLGTSYANSYEWRRIARGGTNVEIHLDQSGGPVAHFAEAYLPLIEGADFRGAVELHVNIGPHVGMHRRGFAAAAGGLLGLLLVSAAIAGSMIFKSIVERDRTERRLRAAKEQAELANRAKTEFLANMSHELRTPLNSILGFASILRSESAAALDETVSREYADDIHNSGQHLLEIINDVLDVSKIETGKLTLQEQSVRIDQLIETCLRLTGQRAQTGVITITTEVAPDLPDVWGDETLLKQMVVNLLSNALKFTPENGRVSVRASYGGEGPLRITIADTGIGIAEAEIPRVAERFYQTETPYRKSYRGTGLGLSLVKSFIELHGGFLEIQSKLGEGTTVSLVLPRERLLFQEVPAERVPA